MKADGHLDSCYLGRAGDASNVILPAVGHNCRLVLAWLRDVIFGSPASTTGTSHFDTRTHVRDAATGQRTINNPPDCPHRPQMRQTLWLMQRQEVLSWGDKIHVE
jgi:hypothetical protein